MVVVSGTAVRGEMRELLSIQRAHSGNEDLEHECKSGLLCLIQIFGFLD